MYATLVHDKFEILETMEYHKIEDELKFLFYKFVPRFDFHKAACWGQLLEFKRFRDSLTHPRQDEDETTLCEYKRITDRGLSAVIEIIDHLCKGIFKKPLRKQLLDLKVK
jgi:hypothetical protein